MSQNTYSSKTAEVSNEQLYQELRSLHRRIVAAVGLVSIAVSGGLYLVNVYAAIPPLVVSLTALVLSVHLQNGKFQRLIDFLGIDPPGPETALEDRFGEPFEVKP